MTDRDLLDERMDERLTARGVRWRETLPAPAEPVGTRQHRRDWIAATATAAAVVVVLGVSFAVTHTDHGPANDPTSTAPLGPDACGAGDLVAGRHRTTTAAGTAYLTTTLALAPGAEPCTVEGYPEVVVLDDGVPSDVETVRDMTLGHARELVVRPDRPVRVKLGWAVFHYCDPIVNDAIRLRLAPGLEVETAGFGPSSCNEDEDEGRPPVRVGAFTYVDPGLARGTVAGVVTLNGGPAPGLGEYVTSGEIEFVGDSDTADASIGADGSYELELPAGEYQVTVSTPQWNGGAPYSDGTFGVTGGELNELNVTLPAR